MSLASASFFELSLALQIALGGGYLAYATSYAGFRRDHSVGDQVAITLVFSAIALVVGGYLSSFPDGWRVTLTLTSTILIGVAWRKVGRRIWHWLLEKMDIHRDDGLHAGWSALVQTDKEVSQATVYTQDGMEFHLADRKQYRGTSWGGLYLGSDGSITMIVDTETDVDGNEKDRTATNDATWGARYTHFPASQIRRFELRMK